MIVIPFLAAAVFAGASTNPSISLEEVVTGLTEPVLAVQPPDDSERWFIVEQGGLIRIFDGETLQGADEAFLDVSEIGGRPSGSYSERGLLGLAFHPDFASNGRFFVNYTDNPTAGGTGNPECVGSNFSTVIAEYAVDAMDADKADENSARIVLTIEQDFGNHNGGHIAFGPDGYLYIGTGDGGSGNDPCDRAQSTDTLLGKMLRIDIDGTPVNGGGMLANPACGFPGATATYAIPSDNPFVSDTAYCPEIFHTGLRNPYRFSFDADGNMFIGDVGQSSFEEIDLAPAGISGLDFGWRCREGLIDTPGAPNCTGTFTDPILVQGRDVAVSITGGVRDTNLFPGGDYIYADFFTGNIFLGREQDDQSWLGTCAEGFCDGSSGLYHSAFAVGEDGELYVLNYAFGEAGSGTLYRLNQNYRSEEGGFESLDPIQDLLP